MQSLSHNPVTEQRAEEEGDEEPRQQEWPVWHWRPLRGWNVPSRVPELTPMSRERKVCVCNLTPGPCLLGIWEQPLSAPLLPPQSLCLGSQLGRGQLQVTIRRQMVCLWVPHHGGWTSGVWTLSRAWQKVIIEFRSGDSGARVPGFDSWPCH